MGMSYDQYWFGDPLMVGAFYKADKLRQERKDSEAWLNGAYVLQALQATVGSLFLKKGQEAAKYPDKPLMEAERIRREQSEKAQPEDDPLQEERERREAAFARSWMIQFCEAGKNWGKNQ